MSIHVRRVLFAIGVLGWVVLSCSMPLFAQQAGPTLSAQEIADTAVARALAAQAAAAPSATAEAVMPAVAPIATQCSPTITAVTDANVRYGPGTDYDIVGKLPTGGTAPVAGRNDTMTWWYIQFAGGYGGYAWIAGSVVTTACIPAVVQVVAAPPLPTAPPPTATQKFSVAPLLQQQFEFLLAPSSTPTGLLFQLKPQIVVTMQFIQP